MSTQNSNSTVTQYINYIQYTRGVSPEDIRKILNDKLRHEMDLHPEKKDPDVLHALRETIKYHPNTKEVVKEFLAKYLSHDEVAKVINEAEKELEKEEKTSGNNKSEATSVDNRDKLERFEKFYYDRTPQSLSNAQALGAELLQGGGLSIHERKRINDVLSKIETALQQKDFSTDMPVEVRALFNKHRTPAQSSMYHLALKYVEDAHDLLKKFAKDQPDKWSHMLPWSEAERLIAELSEKVEILNYKDKADEFIVSGNWIEARNFYRMYLNEFVNDEPVNKKLERLSQLLDSLDNIKNVALGANIDIYSIEKLSAWYKVLQNAAPVLGSSPAYNELTNSYIGSVRPIIIRELNQAQQDLSKLNTLGNMGEVRRSLQKINETLVVIEPLAVGSESTVLKTISEEYERKITSFERYEKIVMQSKSGDEEQLFNAMRSLSLLSSEFGEKEDIYNLRRDIAKSLISRANQKVTFGGAVFFSRNARRANFYMEKAREVVNEEELKDIDAYEKLTSKLKSGRLVSILLLVFICICLLATSAIGGPRVVSYLEATSTMTPSLTPTITVTPSPTLTVTPSPTQMPVAVVNISTYMNVYDRPNGKTQTAYVTRDQVVAISDCVTDDNNISWVEIVWGENNSLKGWLPLEKLDDINGSLFCR